MGAIRNFYNNADKKLRYIVIGFIVAVIAVILIAIINLLPKPQSDQRVTITNTDENVHIPESYQNYVQENIGKILRQNGLLDDAGTAEALIREDTYEETEAVDTITAEFIVDIEAVRQSFEVKVIWSRGKDITMDPNVTITCPHYTDVIYTDTKCLVSSPDEQLKRYLPHYDYANDVKYAVNVMKYVDESYLRIEIPACGDEALRNASIDGTKKWLKSLFLDPNDYRIETVDTCRR